MKRKRCVFLVEDLGSFVPVVNSKSLRCLSRWKVVSAADEYNRYVCTVSFPSLRKYYELRHSLFSLYDSGVLLDAESWYSVTPEKIARHHASVMACDVLVDACCGCGGNSIQFAKTCKRVVSIDIDADKLRMASINAKIYGVSEKIEFVCGNFVEVLGSFQKDVADVLFFSPPWGGPGYKDWEKYPLETIMDGLGLCGILELGAKVAPCVAVFLPKNSCSQDIVETARAAGALSLEIEKNFLGKRIVGITAYIAFRDVQTQ